MSKTETHEFVLVAKNLYKTINRREVVHDLSFEVKPGEVLGFLGPNGAGKTTTIRMITGMITPTSGTVEIIGFSVQDQFAQAMVHLGAVVENPAFYRYLTGWQNLIQAARISGVPVEREHMKWCVEVVELTDRIHDKVSTYSLGMKQRLGIAQSLLASPKLLILDEPTNGMDPSGIKEMRLLIRRLVEEHRLSVFVSSHLLSEVEQLCDRIVIINKGRNLISGPVYELARDTSLEEYYLSVTKEARV